MYSKQEIAVRTEEFWTTVGRYLAPVRNADGEQINWINYKTGVKFLRFHLQVTNHEATIALEYAPPDPAKQEVFMQRMRSFEAAFIEAAGTDWQWQQLVQDAHGRTVSRIIARQAGLDIMKKSDWPALISFFKERLVAVDAFWCQFRFGFEDI